MTVKHALTTCVKFRRVREDIYPGIENLPVNERMMKMLAEGRDFSVESLVAFLRRTDLIKKI